VHDASARKTDKAGRKLFQVLNNVLESLLESNSEVQKEYFGGEIYSAFSKAILLPELTILEYFQKTKQYEDKGIVMIKL
jgi:hypothetical protein